MGTYARRLTPPESRCHESCSSRVGRECDECGGQGLTGADGYVDWICSTCDGEGRVETDRCDCGRAEGIDPGEFQDG